MAEYYNEYPIISLLVAFYAFISFVKVALCLSCLPTASKVMRRHHPELGWGGTIFSVAVAIIVVVPFIAGTALLKERLRFFLAYPNEEVERQMCSVLNEE